MRIRLTVLGMVAALLALAVAQDRPPEEQLPRFRAGANLVRVDAYVSVDGVAVTDLKPEDLEVYEDDKLQRIESVELIEARAPNPQSERTNPTNVRDMRQDAADAARLFTIFMDRPHVSVAGSYHANKPIVETLDRIIGLLAHVADVGGVSPLRLRRRPARRDQFEVFDPLGLVVFEDLDVVGLEVGDGDAVEGDVGIDANEVGAGPEPWQLLGRLPVLGNREPQRRRHHSENG